MKGINVHVLINDINCFLVLFFVLFGLDEKLVLHDEWVYILILFGWWRISNGNNGGGDDKTKIIIS